MLFDAERYFGDVEDALVNAMIFSQIDEPLVLSSDFGFQYAANICVKAQSATTLTELLVPQKHPDYIEWKRSLANIDELDLRFGRFFDFGTSDEEYRDFEFVEVILVGNGSTDFRIGDRILIQALQLEYLDLSSAKP